MKQVKLTYRDHVHQLEIDETLDLEHEIEVHKEILAELWGTAPAEITHE